jgi:E1-E2 ATPase
MGYIMIDDAISITVAVPLIQVVLTGVFGAQQVDLVVHCRYSWFRTGKTFGKEFGSSQQTCSPGLPHHCHVVRSVDVPDFDTNHLTLNREGETLHVLANELVPGDLVRFGTGDHILADIRLVDTVDLEVDESSLTKPKLGRRVPVNMNLGLMQVNRLHLRI